VEIGVDTTWAGIYSIVSALTMTVAYFYWGPYTDRKRPEQLVAIQALCFVLVPITYCFATRPWMLLPATLVGGIIGAGVELSYFTGVLHFAPQDRITSYQALFLSLMGLRGVAGPFIGAALQQSGVLSAKSIFVLSAAIIVVSAIIQAMGMRKCAGKERLLQ
ncbi:MAG: hypothetical protein N3B12_05910, partial [Armatimonadetes bacterium]|nr:hypothetical protein [Armatimonadota bacterium]